MADNAGNPGGQGERPVRGQITAADLLDLERPDGGRNRSCLGMLERAFRYGYIDLIPVDVPDLVRGVEELTKSKNESIRERARALQGRFVEYNAKLVLAAEKLAQNERLAEAKLPPPPGQTPQTVIVIKEGGQAAIAVNAAPAPVPAPAPAPEPPKIGGGSVSIEI